MSLSDNNASIAARLAAAIRAFTEGLLTLDEIQASLQSAASLFENDGSGVAEVVRLAESDIEEIQFAVPRGEQRVAAINRLDQLQSSIEGPRR